MAKRVAVGFVVLGLLVTIVPIAAALSGGFSSGRKELGETRRYLLANDLGITPPMGYNNDSSHYIFSTLILFFFPPIWS